MNILFIHETDWINKVVFDIHSLAENLSCLGHNVYAIDYESTWKRRGWHDWGSLKSMVHPGVSRAVPGSSVELIRPGFIRVPGLSRLSAGLTHYTAIKKVIRDRKIDVIVLYSVPTNGLQVLRLARKAGIPVAFRAIDILNALVPVRPLRPLVRYLEHRVYRDADLVLSLTPMLSRYVVDLGAREDRVKLLLMPVDTAIFRPGIETASLRQKWGVSADERVVLFMGTLFDFSGLDALIPRLPSFFRRVPDARLLIVGDGPQRSRLESLITEHGLTEKVLITGFQPYTDMPGYINLATVCINTFDFTEATRNIFPGKVVQFLACGRPLIATALPGLTAVIEGEAQGVVFVRNAEETVSQMERLLKSEDDRRRLEQAGLSYVTKVHSYDTIAHKLETLLEEAVEEKTRHG